MHAKLNYLAEASNNSLSTDSKIAILSWYHKRFSYPLETLILVIEYFQLISQTFLLNIDPVISQEKDNPLYVAIISLSKLVNPGFILPFGQDSNFTWLVLSVVLLYSVLRYLLFCCLIIWTYNHKELHPSLNKIWKWTFKLNGRVTYGLVTSFWMNGIIQATTEDNLTIFGNFTIEATVIFVILIIIEFIFSLFLNMRYYSVLPTRSLLSSKDTRTESINLIQKFSIQMILVLVQNTSFLYSVSDDWIFRSVNLAFSVLRSIYYLGSVPVYNINGLVFQGFLIMIVAALDVSCVLQIAVYSSDSLDDFTFIAIIWIIMSILFIKLAYEHLKKSILTLAMQDPKVSPNRLIHKLNVIKQIKEQKQNPSDFNLRFHRSYLVNTAIDGTFIDFKSDGQVNLESRKHYHKLSAQYLETVLSRFPRRNDIIKLYLAELYGQKLKRYGIAMQLLIELQNSSRKIIAQNASVLTWRIQNKMRAEHSKNKRKIDLIQYFSSQTQMHELKKAILRQSELQINLYQELIQDRHDLAKIYNDAQILQAYRREIENNAGKLLESIPYYYTAPLLLYIQYQFTLNHSLVNYLKYSKLYNKKLQACWKFFQNDEIISENCFQDRTALVLVSGQKEDLGKIRFCTKSLANIFGGDDSHYIGGDISILAPVDSQNFFPLLSKIAQQEGDHTQLNKSFKGYCYNRDGHVIEVNFHIDIFPYLTKGFYFCFFMRQVQMTEDYIILDDNGIVQGITPKLAQKLELNTTVAVNKFNVTLISEDLAQINQAFNYVNYAKQKSQTSFDENENKSPTQSLRKLSDRYSKIEISPTLKPRRRSALLEIESSKAFELYSIFSTEGGEVRINPITESNKIKKQSVYCCKVTPLSKGSQVLKLVTLQEKKSGYQENNDKFVEQDSSPTKLAHAIPEEGEIDISSSKSWSQPENFSEIVIEPDAEKQAGWIDFEVLSRRKNAPFSLSSCEDINTRGNVATTEGNLLSPLATQKSNFKFTTQLLDDNIKTKFQTVNKKVLESDRKNNSKSTRPEFRHHDEIHGSKASKVATSSKLSRFQRMSQSLDSALSSKYYSRILKLFYVFFYLLMITLLVQQIVLNSTLDTTSTDLKVKKDILKDAQIRDYSIVSLYRIFRAVWESETGSFDFIRNTSFPVPLSSYLTVAKASLVSLVDTNQHILLDVGLIDVSLRKPLFETNVRVYDPDNSSDYSNFTNFQATDQIAQASMKVLVEAKTNITNAEDEVRFILRNGMNDLILQTEYVTSSVLESIELTVEQEQHNITVSLIIVIVLLIVALFLFIWVTWRTYSEVKVNMTALLKLDTNQIKDLQNKLIEFNNKIVTEAIIEEVDVLQLVQNKNAPHKLKKIEDNRYYSQSVDYYGILRKYLFFIVKMVICCAILIAMIVVSSSLGKHSMQSLDKEQSKIYFTNGITKTINMVYLIYQEVFAEKATTIIRNQPIAYEFDQAIDSISVLRNQFLSMYLNDESYSDPIYRYILLGHDCKFLVNSTTLDFCGFLQARDKVLNLPSMLSDYEALLKDKRNKFYNSDRSTSALNAIQLEDYDILLATMRVILEESAMVSTRGNVIFEDKFSNAKTQGDVTLIVSTIILAIVSYVIWVIVFGKLRQNHNEFKNVLKNFPPNLIVSNFILKSFLIKSSKFAFDLNKLDL